MHNFITEEQIKEIAKKIIEAYDPQKIILFGSYVSGKPTEDSDIDLLIIKDTTDSPRERRKKNFTYFMAVWCPQRCICLYRKRVCRV